MNEPTPTSIQPTSQGQTEADLLINLVTEKDFKFFLDQHGQACFVDPAKPFVAIKIDSESAFSVLAKEYYNEYRKAVPKSTISKASYTLKGLTEIQGSREFVHNRIAQLPDQIIYDLGDDENVVIVDSEGWRIVQESPVFFRRFNHQQVQVKPERGGRIHEFLKYINVKDEASQLLILTYLPTAFFSDIERPILLMHGPEGSGKSTCFGFIRSIIDPSILESLDIKKNTDELAIQANEHYCFFIDNVSYLNQEISNSLCRFVTGEAYAKRKLYTDDTTFMMSFKRLVGLNGVAQFASAPDLLDRSIIINLRRLNDTERASNRELKRNFEREKSQLFGAVLDLVSTVMKTAHDLQFSHLPRLADYFRYGCAVTQGLGISIDQFENIYQANVDLQKEESLEASPIALIIRTFIDSHGNWSGPSAQLYGVLMPTATRLGLERYVPAITVWLIRKIKTVENALFRAGIGIEVAKINGERCITISKIAQDTTDSISLETTPQEVV
ncbi:hypothetical protein KBC79_00055 [Candidatus Woesebacteria bacterium]|nr:hypothetical protein [Candidatus Woesebacteria bacterium]